MSAKWDIEEQVDYAIIEQGALQHLKEYEAIKRRQRRLLTKVASYAAAACVTLVAWMGGKESYNARKVGAGIYLADNARSGSEVVALMNEGQSKEAMRKIKTIRIEMESEQEGWTEYDIQELDYLEAVCRLRRGQFISGKKLLRSLVKENGYFTKKAQELLDKL